MRKLYEINKSIEDLLNAITDPDSGEVTDPEALDNLLLEREEKIESVILYYKDVQAELSAVGNEINALNQRADKLENTANGLKIYLSKALEGQNFKTSKCEVKYRKSESVEVTPEFVEWAYSQKDDMSPYITHKESDVPNKVEIKKLLKAGGSLPYCKLVENQNISIK